MDAEQLRDYDYVEWKGRAPRMAATPPLAPRAVIDTTQIWLASEAQLGFWTRELGTSASALRAAIEELGTRCAARLRAYFTATT